MGIKIFANHGQTQTAILVFNEEVKKKFTGWMPVATWSFFKVLKIKVYEILSCKFEQGVGKHERQVADLQNVIQVQASELDVINRQLRFHESLRILTLL